MLLSLFQFQIRFFPEFVLFFLLPIFIAIDIVVLKIALKIMKAPERTGFKWVLVSFLAQVAVLMFIGSPMILIALSGGFNNMDGPPVFFMIAIIPLALFIEINVLNVIHKLGFKKAVFVFVLMIIPFVIMGAVIGATQSAANAQREAQYAEDTGETEPPPTAALFLFVETLGLYLKSL